MTAPLSILAAALQHVLGLPEAEQLTPYEQAERAALLVLRGLVPGDEAGKPSGNLLQSYLADVDRAHRRLSVALDAVTQLDGDAEPQVASQVSASFERALDVYHQSASNAVSAVQRMLTATLASEVDSQSSER